MLIEKPHTIMPNNRSQTNRPTAKPATPPRTVSNSFSNKPTAPQVQLPNSTDSGQKLRASDGTDSTGPRGDK